MDHKVFGGKRAKDEVEEGASDAEGLGGGFGEHDEVVGRYRASHSEHCGLHITVLEGRLHVYSVWLSRNYINMQK